MFVTFEGPDGSGKTTALEKLVDYIKTTNTNFVLTREPGTSHTKESQMIREIIVNKDSNISDMTEALLFSADRRLHLENIIWPALKENKLVLCDRYFDSTFAYQGSGRQLGIQKMIDLQELITEKTYPDITFYFDLPVDVALSRVTSRGNENRLDLEGIDFVKRVHTGYHELIKRYPDRYRVINANQSPEKVFQDVLKVFKEEIEGR